MSNYEILYLGALCLALTYVIFFSERNRNLPGLRACVALIALFFTARYMVWLCWRTVEQAQFSIAYFVAILLVAVESFSVYMTLKALPGNRAVSNRSLEVEQHFKWWASAPPRVDILIPSYNENYQVLERTLVGATGIDYPNYVIHVLDDSNREWVRSLASEFGIDYIARAEHTGYKAGNINHAIRELSRCGAALEFIVIFDADFISRPQFVNRTLSLLGPEHSDIALVQTPQYFFNPDPFQTTFNTPGAVPDDQRYFYDYLLPAWDAQRQAVCSGSSVMIRAPALEQAGLFPEETLAEDFHISINLRNHGWESIYLNEILSVGLAPEGINEFLAQRYRWSMGWLQIARIKSFNKSRKPTWGDYWTFFKLAAQWPLPGIVKPIRIVVPAVLLCFGTEIIQLDPDEILAIFLPLFVSQFGLQWFNGFSLLPIFTDGNKLLLAPTIFRSSYNFYAGREKERFVVTDKGVSRDQWTFHWKVARFPLILLVISLMGIVINVFSNDFGEDVGRVGILLLVLLNCMTLYVAIAPCFEPPQWRRAVRYSCDFLVGVTGADLRNCSGRVTNFSELGAKICGLHGAKIGDILTLDVASLGRSIQSEVEHSFKNGSIGVVFKIEPEERRALIRWIYCSGEFVTERRTWSVPRALLCIAAHSLGLLRGYRSAVNRK